MSLKDIGMLFERVSPLTGKVDSSATAMTAADMPAVKARAAAAMTAETGATFGWAMFNVDLAAGVVREAAAITTEITGEVIPSDKPGCIALALKEPVGVFLGIGRGTDPSSWGLAQSRCRWLAVIR